jgi:hypothetical protein
VTPSFPVGRWPQGSTIRLDDLRRWPRELARQTNKHQISRAIRVGGSSTRKGRRCVRTLEISRWWRSHSRQVLDQRSNPLARSSGERLGDTDLREALFGIPVEPNLNQEGRVMICFVATSRSALRPSSRLEEWLSGQKNCQLHRDSADCLARFRCRDLSINMRRLAPTDTRGHQNVRDKRHES